MASKSAQFFENGTNKQFEFVLSKYQEALQAKADSKNSKSEILLKLDKWYQNELPKKIKSRGKEAHLTHEEIVQTIKWKLARGQFRPRLKDLIQMNTPRVVMQETKKAFRAIYKKNDLEAAVSALSNLKGVGPAMASAVLAAGSPEVAPFMADECLLSMPDVEGIDYTMKEYMKLVEKTKECVERLNAQGGSWNPHKVELVLWAYYIARDLKPEILDDMPDSRGNTYGVTEPVKEVMEERVNGENSMNGEVPLLENGSSYQPPYLAYTDCNDPTPMYSTPAPVAPITLPAQVPEQAPVDYRHVAEPVETPVYTKRPLEETEEATPESKRVREDHFHTQDTVVASASSHISEELPLGGVVPVAPSVPECPAPNGVNSAPPQPIHTGGD
eukprot:GFUD01016271.1.p1 GENE.GFUD01016271.1~~GFUD01016271.1.p1  ORF type:complete len:387 (+),score=101.95 GFUD01016271.1:293-1453(+)